MQKTPYILIVEDEEPISLLIQYNLEEEGFETAQAFDSDQTFEIIEQRTPDLIIMDWMLPGQSGIEIVKELKEYDATKKVPVIMLTAKSEEADKLQGFDTGADDYLTKPFSPKELIARIRSVLKRSKPQLMEESNFYENIVVDNRRKVITIEGRALKLPPTEYDLLEYLVSKAERCCSRDNLLRNVWTDNEEIEGRAVDVAIRRIRAEIEKASPGSEKMIKTVRGEGYMLEKI